jgi:ATP-independent RNA helicase DbpA
VTETEFSTLQLPASWLENLMRLGYRTMTPIQRLALPVMLAGKDVQGHANTGTGKTAAFGLAVLARIAPGGARPGGLVLCPTRELAAQVADEIRRLARPVAHTRVRTLSGGSSIERERASLAHGVDIVVGTPGRVQDHLTRGRLDLGGLATLVLDEADRMLEMGFIEPVSAIARAAPVARQTLLFSATFPEPVRALSAAFQRDAVRIEAPADDRMARAAQLVYELGTLDRTAALVRAIAHHRPESAVIFCNHRETCDAVAAALTRAGFAAVALHGGMDQRDRNTVLLLLRNASLRVLVATDVAARGLDVEDLALIVNYDLPGDADLYTHRIGRTARAGREGLAITLVGPGDRRALADLALADVATAPVPAAETAGLGAAPPAMATLCIQGGRRDRLRPGDIVGALTTGVGIAGSDIGRITVADQISFVAVAAGVASRALAGLAAGRIKNKRFRSYLVEPPVAPGS